MLFPPIGIWDFNMGKKKYNAFLELDDSYVGIDRDHKFFIDKEDYIKIKDFKWFFHYGYIVTKIKAKTIRIHRFIMDCQESGLVVDHIDGNPMNNRKNNLRIVTQGENNKNIKRKSKKQCTSKYIGVHLQPQKWIARIRVNKKTIIIGLYDDELDAARAYNKKAEELGYLTRNEV